MACRKFVFLKIWTGKKSHVSKNLFFICSNSVQSFKHWFLTFKVCYKNIVSLASHIILSLLYLRSLLPLHGDIKSKPWPRNSKNHLSSFCNLGSLPACNFQKMLLLKAYNAIYKHDFICLSESYLDTMIPSDHISLDLEGYKLVCADHPSNVKQGGICMYYKEPLPVRVINLPYHQEALPL